MMHQCRSIMNNDGEMTMMRDDYDAKRPTTGAK